MNQWIRRVGWAASFLSCTMFLSFLDQIRLNLNGTKGSVVLPIATFLSCLAWTLYGYFRPQKEWPIILCNSIGIVLGLVTALTSL